MSGSTITANGLVVEVDGLDLDLLFEEFNRGIILPIVIPEDGPIGLMTKKIFGTVSITSVNSGSQGERCGIRVGDVPVILSADGKVATVTPFKTFIQQARSTVRPLTFSILREVKAYEWRRKPTELDSILAELDHLLCCRSNVQALGLLKEKVSVLSPTVVHESSFIHQICMLENVTSEIIQYLLDIFPDVAKMGSDMIAYGSPNKAYALHCACYNEHCPDSVIELLSKHYPDALEHISFLKEGVGLPHISDDWDEKCAAGLPLHYYLSRASNININMVKMLVEASPESLATADDERRPCYPIHALLSNPNINNLQDILIYLLEVRPSSIRLLDWFSRTPLQVACNNKTIMLETIQILLNAWPEAIRAGDFVGLLPVHSLCRIDHLDETVLLKIIQSMLKLDHSLLSLADADEEGCLPIHYAAYYKSTSFCKILLNAHPESIRVGENSPSGLPIHCASISKRDDAVDTIRYMLELYPESINARDDNGRMPIHLAARKPQRLDTIEFLLKHDPNSASTRDTSRRYFPLQLACLAKWYDVGRGNVHLCAVQKLYDAYPQAINTLQFGIYGSNGESILEIARRMGKRNLATFLEAQLVYVEKSQDMRTLATADENGWLPLHHALKDNAPLGSIKLLVQGHKTALRTAVGNRFPIHIACEFSSIEVVKYLIEEEIDGDMFEYLNEYVYKDYPLHYACRGGNLGVIKYLLSSHIPLVVSSVSERWIGIDNKLPIHLLCEAGKDKVNDRESTEYIETIWLLLLTNPEALIH